MSSPQAIVANGPQLLGLATVPGSTEVLFVTAAGVITSVATTGSGSVMLAGSPAMTGSPTAPTPSVNDNSTKVSTTAYVDAAVSAVVAGLLDFKGNLDASANPNYPAASKGDAYYVSVAGKVGGASGKSVDVGDLVIANADNAGGTEAAVGTSWFAVEHNLAGALLSANNLSDVANAATARTNLGLGSLATQSGTFSGTSSNTNTGDQNLFSTIAVSGQPDVVADAASDTLTLAAGSGITITTNAGTDTITIASSGSGPSAGDPTASVGLAAVNGSASTFMRSDGAPALSQSITPMWTGAHAWTQTCTFSAFYTPANATLILADVSSYVIRLGFDGFIGACEFACYTTPDVGLKRHAAATWRMTDATTGAGKLLIGPSSTTIGAQLHIVASAAGTTGEIVQGAASRTAPLLQLQTSAGASLGNVGGTVFNDFTDTTTTHTDGTEDDLFSYTTVANTLAINGDSIHEIEHVQFVSSATAARRLKKYFAGTLIFDSGALTLTLGGDFFLETTIIRESSTVVRCSVNVVTTSASSVPYATYTRITSLTLTSTNSIKTTGIASGTGAASGDIVNKLAKVFLRPAA